VMSQRSSKPQKTFFVERVVEHTVCSKSSEDLTVCI
jgi:hypothetical protein